MTGLRRFFRKILPLAVLMLPGFSARAESLKSHDCYQEFSSAFDRVKQSIPERFGAGWKLESLPPDIVAELEWITKTSSTLQSHSDSLDSRAFALHNDESELETKQKWLETRMSTLEGRKQDYENRLEAYNRIVTDFVARQQRHNANQCQARADVYQSVCGAYDEEARRMNNEGEQLKARERAFEKERADLEEQRANLESEAGPLASLRTVLEQTRQSLDGDVAEYMTGCEEAMQRARALAEVLATHPTERPRVRTPNSDADVLKGFGQEAVVQAFQQLVLDSEGPGIALTVMDVAGSGMDERSKEIANNTYLLGEYASALQRLKKEGRLRPGDKGYDAIEHMVAAVGKDMPASNAEFTWESLTSLHTLMDSMAAAGGYYVSKKTEHLGAEVMKRVAPEDKQVLGRKGVAFFKALLTRTIQGGASVTTEEMLKLPYDAIQEQKQKATERKVQGQ